MIRILLVDDHDIVMDGIASLLSDVPQLEVVGKASSVEMARELIPVLLILCKSSNIIEKTSRIF